MKNKIKLGFLSAFLIAGGLGSVVNAAMLTRELQIGMSGADVGTLQTFLAIDPAVYPQALVTNYFGSMTKIAVMRFQSKNGISTVGRVGPQTLGVINSQMGNGNTSTGADRSAAIISNVSVTVTRNTATIGWNTSENVYGKVYYSASMPTITETQNQTDVAISGNVSQTDNTLRNSQFETLVNLNPNTMYYYTIYTKDPSGNVQMKLPQSFVTQP